MRLEPSAINTVRSTRPADDSFDFADGYRRGGSCFTSEHVIRVELVGCFTGVTDAFSAKTSQDVKCILRFWVYSPPESDGSPQKAAVGLNPDSVTAKKCPLCGGVDLTYGRLTGSLTLGLTPL